MWSISYTQRQIHPLSGRYIFFVVDVFTSDRACDLGRLQCCNVYKLRDWEGYLLRSTLTKNIHCAGSPLSFTQINYIRAEVCPVAWVK